MLLTADWVLPIGRAAIRDGAVVIENGRIAEVGHADELASIARTHERVDFGQCAIMPGLINAHTHLSLSALAGVLEPASFENWLPQLVKAMSAWSTEDHAAAAALGARSSLLAGVTVVGDIVYGPESAAAALDAGLGGVFYWEVLGFDAPRLFAELERIEFPGANGCGRRSRCGLSPHSVYTSGPRLLQAVHRSCVELDVPFAIHLAESAAEVELVTQGTGPLSPVAERNAIGFAPEGSGPVAYCDHLGVLDGATVIHAGHALPTDFPRLAATARGAVVCPRSNRFLGNPVGNVRRLLHAGVPVGIGTDSSASNEDLDLFAEARLLQDIEPTLSAYVLLQCLTAGGAVALGIEDRFGLLEPGMEADVSVFRIGATSAPEESLLRLGGAATVEAVMTGGTWRVLQGRIADEQPRLDERAAAATARAVSALSS